MPVRTSEVKIRRFDIDWLRIIAVFSVIALHSAVIFSWGLFNVKHTQHTLLVDSAVIFFTVWIIPLLFVLAGVAAKFSLDKRTPGEFSQERRKRLLVPAIFWFVVPAIIANVFKLNFLLQLPGNPRLAFTVVGTGHLWFILYLLIFTFVSLPIFGLLRKPTGQRAISFMARIIEKPGMIFLFAIPLMGLALGDTDNDLLKFLYLIYYIYGFVIFSDGRFIKAIAKQVWFALTVAIVLVILIIFMAETKTEFNGLTSRIIEVSARWFWVVTFLGLGDRFLNHTSRLLRYLSEASYPVYILGFLVTALVGYFIAPLPWLVDLKYLAIVIFSVLITVFSYDLLVKRTNFTRFLFGMKPKITKP